MKNILNIRIWIAPLALMLMLASCDKDFVNPNSPTEEVVLNTKDGLYAISIGLNQYYSTVVMRQIVEAPGITTRELGVTNTFLNINELAKGGSELSGESGGITNPWVRLLRAKGMAEAIIDNVDNADLSAGTKSGLLAYANLYKAMTLGYLVQMFEQVPINNAADGQAIFSDRAAVLAECIKLLEQGRDGIAANPISDEFSSKVLGADMDLLNTINAYLSRYNLMAGNYNDAISSADVVLGAVNQNISMLNYDANNVNPIWNRTVNSDDLNPQSNFGLMDAHIPEVGDGRIAFYLGADAGTALVDAGGQPLSEMLGFFATPTSSIPLYLKGELLLNKAEAHARLDNLTDALIQLNLVRMKNDDPLGVNANLPAWTGDINSKTDILEEIYKNRAIEMFLTGMRLEDSRRFHPDFSVLQEANTTNERNRNFYPYPTVERENNSNTPVDPAI